MEGLPQLPKALSYQGLATRSADEIESGGISERNALSNPLRVNHISPLKRSQASQREKSFSERLVKPPGASRKYGKNTGKLIAGPRSRRLRTPDSKVYCAGPPFAAEDF